MNQTTPSRVLRLEATGAKQKQLRDGQQEGGGGLCRSYSDSQRPLSTMFEVGVER